MNLKELYQEVILDHNLKPRNFKVIESPTAYSHGLNPLCGDDYHLYVVIDDHGVIHDIGFQGEGCAISKSSASMMTAAVKGKTVAEALAMQEKFYELVVGNGHAESLKPALGKLVIFEGVKQFPARVKCANLIWRALEDALKGYQGQKHAGSVSTE